MTDVHHVPSAGVKYPAMLQVLFYCLFSASVMQTVLEALPVRFTIPFGTSRMYETDLLMLLFLSLWSLTLPLVRRRGRSPGRRVLTVLLLILTLPVAVGLVAGKSPATVLRDVRTPIFYLGILPILEVLRRLTNVRRLVAFLVAVGLLSVVVAAWMWEIGGKGAPDAPERFGIASALLVAVWVLNLAIAYLGLAKPPRLRRWLAWLVIAGVMALVFVFNDIRSAYVGVAAGVMVQAGALYRYRRTLGTSRAMRRLIVTGATLGILMGGAAGALWSAGSNVQHLVLQDTRFRRLYSLIDPTEGGVVDVTGGSNRDDRLLGASYGFNLGARNLGFGLGYGDNDFVDLDDTVIANLISRNSLAGNPGNVVENLLLFHNSYGWAFGRLGVWLACGFFTCVGLLLFQAWKATLTTPSIPLRILLLGTSSSVVSLLVLGFGGGAFFDYTGRGLVTWLVCLAVLIRGTELAREAGRAVIGRPSPRRTHLVPSVEQPAHGSGEL